jgi:tetratricopeptide (TPR) repeat protein
MAPSANPIQVMGGAVDVTTDSTTSFRLPGPTPVVAPPSSVPMEPRVRASRDLLAALKVELDQHPKPMRAGRLYFETGRLHESPHGEFKEAAEAFLKAHALLGDHLPSIRGARPTLLALGRAQETLPLFDAELRLTPEPEQKAQILYDKAGVLEDLLGQKKEAREVLEIAAELGKSDATRVKSIERAESLARAWEPLGRALERESNAIKDDPRHRSALIGARARLLEAHRGDPATAVELYKSAADGDPQSSSALHALKRLHYGHQRWRDLITVLEREAELAADPGVRALSYYRMGRLWLDRLGNVDDALGAMERAAREGGSDPMILEELARLYELAGRHADLALVLERLAERGSSPADQLACFLRIGELYETRLSDDSKAIVWYERARAVDRCYIPVLQALSELYTQKSEFEKLVEVHIGEAEGTTDPARRAAAYARVAELYETNLGRPEQAMVHHARALGVQPGYASSFKALVRLLTQAQKYPELVELYERAVDQATDPEGKVLYLYKIGRLYEDALSSPAQALVAYRRILEIAPHEVAAVHSLQRSAERAGLFKDLIAALELEADRVPDKRRKLELYHRAGEVAETDLKDDSLAINMFKRLIEIDKTFAPAYASLGRLYYKAGRWEELIDTYKSELRLLPKGPTLSALQLKMGQLQEERLGHDEDALGSYRRAVEADPSHRAAVRALERKLEQKGVWDELVRVLEAELGTLEEPKLKARTLLRIGEVCENRLRAPEKALLSYEQALALDAELAPARDGRIRLLTEARDYRRLVEELEHEASAQRDGRLATWALLRAGEVYRDDLGDPHKAVRAFEAVLERDPSHVEALLALEPLYAERGAWDLLANVYAAEARVLSDKAARVGALRELGRLQQSGKVTTPDHGRQAFGAILQLMPGDTGALFALERIALVDGDAALLAHVDSNLAAALSDPISIATHETRLGELLEAAGDPQALDVFRAALARDAEGIGAARGLSRIAERSGDPALLGEAAEREARVLLDVGRAASGLVQAGERLWGGGDFERATQAFARALEIDPDHEQATARIAELLLSRNEVDRLLALLTRAAGAAKKTERAAALWTSVADLHATRKHDLAAALAVLQRAQTLHPKHVPILVKLADLYASDGQWSEAVERLKQALAGKPDAQTAVEANFRLGSIIDEHLDDPARALTHLDAVLNSEPNHRGALERLAMIQARRGQFDQAAETAQRLVRMSPEIKARVSALTLLGRVERQRGQFEAAAHAYEQAVAVIGVEGTAAQEFRELVSTPRPGDNPTFTRYLAALVRYIESTTAPPAAAFVEVARTLSERMNQPDQALSWLERGLNVHSSDIDLRSDLAQRLLRVGQHQRAVAELERVVSADPSREGAWRQLAEGLQRLQRSGDGSVGVAPLVALGFANDLERATWSTRVARTAAALPGSFGSGELSSISPRTGDDPAVRLIAALGDIASKLYPPELERWNVTSRDRLSAKSGHPTRALADRLAAVFGLGDYELYVHRAHAGLVELELTDPISVLVPVSVTSMSEAEQAFLLGRALAMAARGLAAVDRLPPSSLGVLLAAGARLIEPNFSAGEHDEEFLSVQSRKLSKALPWLGRGPIEDAARAYAQAPLRDLGDWTLSVKVAAARAAAILADDLPSSVALVRKLEGDLSGATGTALAQGARISHDLVRFWISEAAFVLRRRLGLA